MFQPIIWSSSGRPKTHNSKSQLQNSFTVQIDTLEFSLCALHDVSNCDFDLDVFGLPEDDHIIGSNK